MNDNTTALQDLYNRTPRRHNDENIKEINSIVTDYEDMLIKIEGMNTFYEKQIPAFFDAIEAIKITLKKSNDKKASKKMKDSLFDEGSGALKDSIEALIEMYGDGSHG
jgi:uncharacterized protein YqgV (UPF0045/DUF77 family)